MTEENTKLYVGNLPFNVTEKEVAAFAEEKGVAAVSITIVKDRYTDRSKGFGFITVETEEQVQPAIDALNGQELEGRALNVSQARPREKRNGGGGSSAGGSGFRPRSNDRRPHGGGGSSRGGNY